MQKITPCLWFDGQAEPAARFYVSLLPDSRIDRVMRSPADTPSGPAGMVLTVEFTLAGNQLHLTGPHDGFSDSTSYQRPRQVSWIVLGNLLHGLEHTAVNLVPVRLSKSNNEPRNRP